MTLVFGLVLVALGFAGAFVSGLVGVGGAIVMIPLLYYGPPLLGVGGLEIEMVTGVTMVQVLAASVIGTWTHARRDLLHRSLAWTAGTAMSVGSLCGAIGSRYVSGRVLLGVFAAMATVALPLMLVRPVGGPEGVHGTSTPFNRGAAIGYPAAIGVVAGLVGAGGAFLLVPVLIALVRIPVRISIGTSLAIVGMAAVAGVLGKALTGQVPLGPTAAVVLGALAGARLGAMASHRAPVGVLRGVLGALIALVMVRVWADVLFH